MKVREVDGKSTEIELDRMDSLRVITPEGLVYVSTIFGTQVMVYGNPERNPVGMVALERKEN